MNQPQPLYYQPQADDPPRRLDIVLGRWLSLSRSQVRSLLESGQVEVNGRVADPKDKGRMFGPGDATTVHATTPQGVLLPAADPDLELCELAHGPGWIVIDKPAGVPVRPRHPGQTGCVINALIHHDPGVAGVGEGGLRSGVVHRLDTQTSGCLLVATAQDAWLRLREAFAEHRITKRYTAIVHGRLECRQHMVRHLVVARHHEALVRVYDQPDPTLGTRECSMTWQVIETADDASLVEIDLGTGFLHQVRAMMAYAGHPLVGDDRYGPGRVTFNASRHMLHAGELSFDDVNAKAPLPQDMQQVWQSLCSTQ